MPRPVGLRTPGGCCPRRCSTSVSSRICHQRPERSFAIAGIQMPVCARCSGLYVSGALGGDRRMADAAGSNAIDPRHVDDRSAADGDDVRHSNSRG